MIEPILFYTLLFLHGIPCFSLPLSTNGRWIVDAATGSRVKLACVNWPSHMETMLAEGLQEKPLKYIVSQVAAQQFNCVRLTWATYMFTRPDYANRTVSHSFDSLNLTDAKAGIAKNNPSILKMTLLQAYDAVVDELGVQGLMVDLDNHVSKPTWCCGSDDGNGFFGDKYFDTDEWLQGLTTVATRFKDKSQVIAIGMRNELRGRNQNVDAWYENIIRGATEIHKANPDVIIFVSGLSYAHVLGFLKQKPLAIDLNNKLVYEAHWYAWQLGGSGAWQVKPLGQACAQITQSFNQGSGFVNGGDHPVPLFLGEFGVDQRGPSKPDDQFLNCFLAYATNIDLDWGMWALQGSYYFRENQPGAEETFGVFDYHWNGIRNPALQNRLHLIKKKNQDPNSKLPTSYIMFHPESGSCVHSDSRGNGILAGDCNNMSRWVHNADGGSIMLSGTNLCLKVVGDGLAPNLSTDCSSQQSSWTMLSETKLQLAAKNGNGEYLCLQKDSTGGRNILTGKCICTEGDPKCLTDPSIQWFKLVTTNV